jgi:hypothetical protein
MGIVDVLAVISALWLAGSAIALVVLAALYVAERARSRDAAGTVTMPGVSANASTAPEAAEPSRRLEVA